MARRILKYWLPAALWMTVIFVASTSLGSSQNTSRIIEPLLRLFHLPEGAISAIHYSIRKSGHFIEYAILGILLWRSLRSESFFLASGMRKQIALAILLCAFYAGSDELHQLFVSTRECSVRDVIIDTCGASAGIALVCLANRRRLPS